MPEGNTIVIYREEDSSALDFLIDGVNSFDVGEVYREPLNESGLYQLSFEHNGSYSVNGMTKLIRKLNKDSCSFLRAYHSDEYAQETLWLISDGKYKKYEVETDVWGAEVVKAYTHWHSGLGDFWYGSVSKDDLEIIAERHGQFDEKGRKIKGKSIDFEALLDNGKDFIGKGVRAPYAGVKWDEYIPVYESFAKYYAMNSEVPPDNGEINYERNYYFSDFLGYAWTWKCKGRDIILLLTFPGSLGMDRNLLVNLDGLSLDELIILDRFGRLEKDYERRDSYDYTRHVEIFDPFHNSDVIPPSTEYLDVNLPGDYKLIEASYNFDGFTMWVECAFECDKEGGYYIVDRIKKEKDKVFTEENVYVTLKDVRFSRWLDSLSDEKFSSKDYWSLEEDRNITKRVILCKLLVVFDADINIREVLRGDVSYISSDEKGRMSSKILDSWG